MTLFDLLLNIYKEYGFQKEKAVSVVKPGKSGADEIKAMMENFRNNPPKELGGSPVVLAKDFKTLKQVDCKSGAVSDLDMPATSNVLQYFTENGAKVSVRPSGTEPKIKFYCEVPAAFDGDYVKASAGVLLLKNESHHYWRHGRYWQGSGRSVASRLGIRRHPCLRAPSAYHL